MSTAVQALAEAVDSEVENIQPVEGRFTPTVEKSKSSWEVIDVPEEGEAPEEDEEAAENTEPETEVDTETESESETTDTETAEEEGETEEDADEDEVAYSPEHEWLREFRKEHKEQKKELRTKEQELEELKRKVEELQKPPPKSEEKEVRRFDPSQVFQALAKMESGEIDSDPQLYSEIDEQIALMTPEELQSVKSKARMNGFGELSEDIKKLVADRQIDVYESAKKREESTRKQERWQERRQESISKIKQIPGMDRQDSPVMQAYLQAATRLQEAIPTLSELPNAPELVMQELERSTKSKLYDTKTAVLEKKVQELTQKLNQVQSGSVEGTVAIKGVGKTKLTAEEELRKDWIEMGLIST